MDRPRPVPSPAGLVVKKGLNIFSFISGGMPGPLSRILISTLSLRFLVVAVRVGLYAVRRRDKAHDVTLAAVDSAKLGVADADGFLQHSLKHRLKRLESC